MNLRATTLTILRAIEKKFDPPYAPATPEERLLNAIFATAENHPWPAEVQPMPGNVWRTDQTDADWASYIAEAVEVRASTFIGSLQVAHELLSYVAAMTDGERPEVSSAAHEAEKIISIFLDRLKGDPPFYYDCEYGDDISCKCGHTYYQHFDAYNNMEPDECAYCYCGWFRGVPDGA